MGKNKKKSISKVIIASPLSNGSDNDEPVKSEELTTLSSPSNLSEEDLTTLVKIKLEPEPEILMMSAAFPVDTTLPAKAPIVTSDPVVVKVLETEID